MTIATRHASTSPMDSTVHQPKAPVRGRLAPSPTGHLHLGNIWSFLLCWLDVRSAGGTLVLRMEDIDPDRSRPEYAEDIMRDLEWLGIDWDEGPDRGGPYGPYTQSERLDRYAEVMDRLESMGLTYPCFCTRKELRSLASAPHAGDFGPAYPGTCLHLSPAQRAALVAEGRHATIRLHGTHDNVSFTDRLRGTVTMSWAECGGDFPLRRSDGVVSYQLAVAVDDMDQRITSVVRGDDILHCTPRQILLHELLGATPPLYAHVPLVLDAQGERLAKRHRHYEIRMLRERGVSAQAIIGYLAARAGLLAAPAPARPQDFAAGFDIARIAPVPVILEPDIEDILAELSRR